MSSDAFIGLPSRRSAEPEHRTERERLLREVAERGDCENYTGIRMSRTGRLFRIEAALVFNLEDEAGRPAGQAATFSRWTFLEEAFSPSSLWREAAPIAARSLL